MPLSFSNTVSPAQAAINKKANPLSLSGAGSPFGGTSTYGVNNLNMTAPKPANLSALTVPTGSATAPVQKAPIQPLAAKPVASSYKGTLIAPGDDASVAAQVAKIDGTPQSTGLVGGMLAGHSVGTQHPGDAGFSPTNSKPAQTATAEYGTNGQYIGTLPAGAPTNTQTPVPATFPGIVGGLTTASTNGSGAANLAAYGLLQSPNQNQILGDKAAQIGDQYGQKIADVGQKGAQFESGQLTTGTSPVASGNAAVTAQTTAAQQQALATGEAAALQGNAQQLTAQQQAQAGLTSAGGLGNQSQGLTQSGLTSAGTLAQPNTAAYGQTTYNPLTNSFGSSGSNLDPQTQAGTLAQQVQSGQITYDQALQSMGYAGQAGTTFLNNAITAAGGNPLQLQAQGAATQGVIGSQQTQIAGYQSAMQQGQNLQSQLTDLISSFGLNPSDINAVNSGLQKIAQNTSSPQYKILSNYVNDIANTYSQVLTPPGGSATDTTRGIATSMLDATAKGTSLIQTMHSLDEAAKAKIAGVSTTGASTAGVTHGSSGPDAGLFNW